MKKQLTGLSYLMHLAQKKAAKKVKRPAKRKPRCVQMKLVKGYAVVRISTGDMVGAPWQTAIAARIDRRERGNPQDWRIARVVIREV